eukprot:10947586-Alexandrium_andersonii.AAC.1
MHTLDQKTQPSGKSVQLTVKALGHATPAHPPQQSAVLRTVFAPLALTCPSGLLCTRSRRCGRSRGSS